MRIWSLHPCYLDAKGLVALWRETLLAKNVLAGNTKGYQNHPQLNRFKATANPLACINQYLVAVYDESIVRGYRFNADKIDRDSYCDHPVQLTVTVGQLAYETQHLLAKLAIRDIDKHAILLGIDAPLPHPMFVVTAGDIADWEVTK